MIGALNPLVLRDWRAGVLLVVALAAWGLSELNVTVSHWGGTGADHDAGSRHRLVLMLVLVLALADGAAWFGIAAIEGWWPVVAGAGAILAGVALRRWAISELGRLFTAAVEIQADHTVVDTGPYRVVRHPSYAGGLISLVGLGLALGSWASVLVLLLGGALSFVPRIRVEERALLEHLGPPYADYARHHRRLIPGVW